MDIIRAQLKMSVMCLAQIAFGRSDISENFHQVHLIRNNCKRPSTQRRNVRPVYEQNTLQQLV